MFMIGWFDKCKSILEVMLSMLFDIQLVYLCFIILYIYLFYPFFTRTVPSFLKAKKTYNNGGIKPDRLFTRSPHRPCELIISHVIIVNPHSFPTSCFFPG